MATYYIDPTAGSGGAGTLADPINTWVGMAWTASDVYLQKESTTYTGSASISPTQNDIVFGTYDAATGVQIQDNTRHATIANTSGQGINCNNRTGITIDNLRIVANASSGHAIQALYTNSATALSLAVRRCILSVPSGGGACIRGRGDGLTIEDIVADCAANGAALSLTCINVTIRRSTVAGTQGTAVSIASSADDATTAVNVLIEDCDFTATGTGGASGGDALLIKGNGVTIRRLVSAAAWDNSIILRCQNVLVEDCTLSGFDLQRSGGDGIQLVGTHDVLSCTIRNNVVTGSTDSPVKQCLILGDSASGAQTGPINVCGNVFYGMAYGVVLNLPGAKFLRNRITAAVTGGLALSANGCECWSNYIESDGVGIGVDTTFTGGIVEGNTIVSAGSCLKPNDTDTVFKNNLCIATAGAAFVYDTAGSSTFTSNHYSGAGVYRWNDEQYSTLAAYQTASSQDTTSLDADPLLTSTYRPKAGSPLLQAGTFISYAQRDIEGKQRPNPPSIGAYDVATMRIV